MKIIRIVILLLAVSVAGDGYSAVSSIKTSKSAYGWSTSKTGKDVVGSVNKCVLMMGMESPDFIFLFSTEGYDSSELLKAVRNNFGNNVKIYGGTSCQAVQTPDGFHSASGASMAMLGVKSDKILFGVGGAEQSEDKSPGDIGYEAALAAIENAGKSVKDKPDFVFMTAYPGAEESVLEGVERAVGKKVPVFGNSAADDKIVGNWKEFANDTVYKQGVSIAVVYTDLKIGYAYDSGYLRSLESGEVTKASGRILYEINNRPAAEVYNEWLGGTISDMLVSGGNVWSQPYLTTFNPLSKLEHGRSISIYPFYVNVPDRSLTMFADVKRGDTVSLMRGNWELLLNRAYTVPSAAYLNGNMSAPETLFGFYVFCAGTMLAMPPGELKKMPALVGQITGDMPYIGMFSFGEQGFLSETGNIHGNLGVFMVVFAEK